MSDVYVVLIDWLSKCGDLAIFFILVRKGFNWLYSAFEGRFKM